MQTDLAINHGAPRRIWQAGDLGLGREVFFFLAIVEYVEALYVSNIPFF
jgi:hypothetical protein